MRVTREIEGTAPPRRSLLGRAALWALRALLVAAAVYVGVQVLVLLDLAVIPVIAALLFTALLWPLNRMLRRPMPNLLAAWITLIIAVFVLGGMGYLIGMRIAATLPLLIDQLINTVRRLGDLLAQLGFGQVTLNSIENAVVNWLQSHRSMLRNVARTGARYLINLVTMLLLTIFVTLFLLYEGERVWRWLISPLEQGPHRRRIDRAGHAAWNTVTGYVHGTVVIAIIHGIVIGLTLFLLGVPLVLPLSVLVFLGSFIPIVGAIVAGTIAVLVTLVTQGIVEALILLAVLLVENQLEGNVLQPLVMKNYVRLHPLAIGLVLVVGGILAGLVGMIIAVPTAAVVHRIWTPLMGSDEQEEQTAEHLPEGWTPTERPSSEES
ncbi:putative PurR-regulated permease PerM [Halopolyspora algeriensis]|uniref:Putative PurR-regulated permease PerM n=2 Tax=Halopolyspora algeriensis TaxID=1500506 RepID=A0A368VZG3_9ACTN|nr:putative PurR-regulated permease PerM [Halopolyspora algeriensis]TQM42530.1 putative PurR-regulated permease PerM [Halopolyspora algeriensis]